MLWSPNLSPFFPLLKYTLFTKLTLPKHTTLSNSPAQSPQCSQIIPALAFRQQTLGNKADAEPGLCLHNLCAAETGELQLHKPPWQCPAENLKAPRSISWAESGFTKGEVNPLSLDPIMGLSFQRQIHFLPQITPLLLENQSEDVLDSSTWINLHVYVPKAHFCHNTYWEQGGF